MAEPKRILVRSGKAPEQVLTPEAAFAYTDLGVYARNSGNAIFTSAVYRLLNTPDAEVVSDGWTTERPGVTDAHIDRINNEFDALVLPMSNSLRMRFTAGRARLTKVIRKLKIPVVVVGVGSQLSVRGDWHWISDEVKQNTREFVAAVLDHSASIGVRGEITRDYLLHLGFADSDVDVIGCPSMYDNGRDAVVTRKVDSLTPDSPIAVNVDYRVAGLDRVLTENQDRYPNLTLISQDQQEAALLLWGKPIDGYPKTLPGTIDHPLYRQDRIRFFPDPIVWRRFLATKDFSLGSRLHGTLAALSAGTPAFLTVHDSRTLEVAKFHGIPFRLAKDISGSWDAARFYDELDLAPLNRVRAENFDRYVAFIERNGLGHIYQPGKANPEYEAVLEAAPHPDGFGPLTAAAPEQLASRLCWLWQGTESDRTRIEAAHRPDFFPNTDQPSSLDSQLKSLEKRLAVLEGGLWGSIRRRIDRGARRLAGKVGIGSGK